MDTKRTMNLVIAALTAWGVLNTSTPCRADGIDEPAPTFYQEPGLSPNRDYVNQHANEHIDPFSGKLQWHFVDLFIPGNGGLDLKVQRSYSSLNEQLGEMSAFGVGWTMHFGRVLRHASVSICDVTQGPSVAPVLELPDGSRQILYVALDQVSFISTARWKATCNTQSGGLNVFSPDGTRYEMTTQGLNVGSTAIKQSAAWYTTRMVDRNGNTMNFTYANIGSAYGVTGVTTSDGRTVTFNYQNGVLFSVTSGSRTWGYAFTPVAGFPGQFFLSAVTRPDSTQWAYEYNATGSNFPGTGTPGGFSLKKVTYPTGGTVSYTYGFVTFNPAPFLPPSTVVAQKAADGATWTYAYRPATQSLPANGQVEIDPTSDPITVDKTTVVGPEGTTVYFHVGYTSAVSGIVYLIGSLMGKGYVGVQNEAYSWQGQQISGQTNQRPGGNFIFDSGTFAPTLFKKSVNRNGQNYVTQLDNFDSFGNPQLITESGTDTRATTVSYVTDPDRWVIHLKKDETTDTIGTITRLFDANFNLSTESRYGVATSYAYTGEGDISQKTDARSNSIGYGVYLRGIPQTETQLEGVTISRIVSNDGNVVSQTDGEGATTTYQYDGLNRLTNIGHLLGNSVSVAWLPNSRTVTRGPYRETVTFDAFGRQNQVQHTDSTSGQVITQNYGYDKLGRRIFASYPNDVFGTGFQYDMIGQTTVIIHVSDSTATTGESGRGFFYNANQVQVTNERGKVFNYTYRAYGDPEHRDLMAIASPEPGTGVAMTRNGLGQLTQVVQDGVSRSYGYDPRFFMTSMTDPEVGQTTFGRDAVGNMTSRSGGAAGSVNISYDGRNRPFSITYAGGTPSVTKTYYRDDKVKTVDNGIALRQYTFDPNKNLTQESLTGFGQPSFITQYAYDGNDALNTITYGSGRIVTYSPDGFGRPTMAAPYLSTVTHHPTGQVASITYANGVTTLIALNERKWPNSLIVSNASGNIFNTGYAYDDIGNVTQIADAVDSSYNRLFDYDGVDRLTTASGAWGSGVFHYDGHGNITQQALGTLNLTYTYAPNNQLASISGTRPYTFTYDAHGNVTGNGTNTFAYDDVPNMRCAKCGLAGEIDYDYDGANMRVRSAKAGIPTFYVYGMSGSLLWEQTPGVNLKEYVYLSGKQVAVLEKRAN